MASYDEEHGVKAPPRVGSSLNASSTSSRATFDVSGFMGVGSPSGSDARRDGSEDETSADPVSNLLSLLTGLRGSFATGGGLLDALLADARVGFREGNPPTSASVISTLPTRASMSDCPICTESLSGAKAVYLPCKHSFHNDCLVPWLRVRNTCPVCRHELPTDDEEYEKQRRAKKAEEIRKQYSSAHDDDDDDDNMYG